MTESRLNKLIVATAIVLLMLLGLVLVYADEIDNYKFVSNAINKVITYNIQHQFSYEYGYLNNLNYITKT